MIDNNLQNASKENSDDDEWFDEISKSQRKRDAQAIRELGTFLAELGTSELATIPLPDDVLDAITSLQSMKSNSARKRQLGFLAKQLRNVDLIPIERAIDNIKQTARAHAKNFHLVEEWRDRILGDTDQETPKDALTTFFSAYPEANKQQLRQLQRQALKQRESDKSKAAARQLFKVLRGSVISGSNND